MIRRSELRTTAVLVAGLLASAGCSDTSPVRIGIVVGEAAMSGAQAAAATVNASGGIGGRPLELVLIPESAAAAEPAIHGAEALAGDPMVLAVVGHGNSAATLAASQVYNARGLPHVAPTSTATLLRTAGPYSFRLVPSDRRQAAALVDVAGRLAPLRRAAIVYENDDYGRGLLQDVSRELAAAGVAVVASMPYMAGVGGEAVEFIPSRIAADPPEVVFWLGRYERLPRFLAAMRATLPGVVVLSSEGVDSPELYRDPADFAGLHFLRFVDAGSTDPCMVRLREWPGAEMGGRAQDVLTHDAVLLIAEVMRAGARTRTEVRDRLAVVGSSAPAVRGCAGEMRFDPAGDIDRSYHVARADSSGIHPVTVPPR